MEELKGIIAAAGLDYWLALPLLYIVAALRRMADAIGIQRAVDASVNAAADRLTFGDDFWAVLKDLAWGAVTCAVAVGLAALMLHAGVVQNDMGALGLGLVHGIGSIILYEGLKKSGIGAKVGLVK